MDITNMIPYAATPRTTNNTNDTAKTQAKNGTENTRKTGANQSLQVDDFLKLLASQLQNQDMMNPMKDTEFMGQLAQFTMLQSIAEMKDYVTNSAQVNATSYAMSLVGKTATAATLDKDGKMVKVTGEITGVTLYEGQPIVYIGEKGFYLSQIMVVGEVPEDAIPDDKPDDKPDQGLPEVPPTPDQGLPEVPPKPDQGLPEA